MHEHQGFFCKSVNHLINDKNTVAGKKYYMGRIWLHYWANREEDCGRSPMGLAQDGEEGEASAGPWRPLEARSTRQGRAGGLLLLEAEDGVMA